jgi:hypothetical protein
MSGHVLVSSSSLLFPNSQDLYLKDISVEKNVNDHSSHYSFSSNGKDFNYTRMRNLHLYGDYNVTVSSNGLLYFPSLSSLYDYFKFRLPAGTNISVNLSNSSRAEFSIPPSNRLIEVTAGKIEFNGIKSGGDASSPDENSISVLIKDPRIKTQGKAIFHELHSNNPNDLSKPWAGGIPIQTREGVTMTLEHGNADAYNRTNYITYFKWIQANISTNGSASPETLSQKSLEIPWQEAINANINIRLIVTILIASLVSIYLRWPSISLKDKGSHLNK